MLSLPNMAGGFFIGLHMIQHAYRFNQCCISINCIRNRRSSFTQGRWMMDSGAFTEISTHGRYRYSESDYARQIRSWAYSGKLLTAVSQDYMCEEFILKKTGLTVKEHQRLTVQRYDNLKTNHPPIPPHVHLMPVLQGYEPSEYIDCLRLYGDRLTRGMWVGVGSVCKRNASPDSVRRVLSSILDVRSDLRLHGFGLKITALEDKQVRSMLYSADSMAWSMSARRNGGDANGLDEAFEFYRRINRIISEG